MRFIRHLLPLPCLCGSLVVIAGVALPAGAQATAPNEWTWVGGSMLLDTDDGQPGVYGTLGMPTAGSTPGGRFGASSAAGGDGHFWLFGGQGYDGKGNWSMLDDLWAFSPATNEWAWMSGPSVMPDQSGDYYQLGIYGKLGSFAAGNVPGSRIRPLSWVDGDGNFWLFGGYGCDETGIGYLNDLWEFNPSTREWEWIGGSSTTGSNGGQSGVYGTLGMPDPGKYSRRTLRCLWLD
ncbi:MAG: kelch repeat-containing protein [Terracidiphilus sp.]